MNTTSATRRQAKIEALARMISAAEAQESALAGYKDSVATQVRYMREQMQKRLKILQHKESTAKARGLQR